MSKQGGRHGCLVHVEESNDGQPDSSVYETSALEIAYNEYDTSNVYDIHSKPTPSSPQPTPSSLSHSHFSYPVPHHRDYAHAHLHIPKHEIPHLIPQSPHISKIAYGTPCVSPFTLGGVDVGVGDWEELPGWNGLVLGYWDSKRTV